jgi:hypothetical protein
LRIGPKRRAQDLGGRYAHEPSSNSGTRIKPIQTARFFTISRAFADIRRKKSDGNPTMFVVNVPIGTESFGETVTGR